MDALIASPVTFCLLAANVIASLIAFGSPDFREQNNFWIRPMREGNQWHRLVTSGFLHVDFFHLFINMYVLYGFGPALERVFGPVGYFILYMGSLLGGSAWMYADKRNVPDYRAVGASGAISGLMLSVSVLAPFATLLFMGVLPMWSIVFGVGFIIISYILSHRENAVIAHGGHLGGAIAGLVLTLVLKPDSFSNLLRQIAERFG
ncbi:MAG: rhomboid family intramembrane serine protease [Hyphomonas sp.]|nr:rhomboid family intramembrane serine protease [Hyphomonas sp.]